MPRKQCLNLFAIALAVVCEFLAPTTRVHALSTEQVLYNFNYDGGTNPDGGLILDAAGNLYGTASLNGPTGAGTVFELLPNGSGQWDYEELYNFCSVSGCPDGEIPQAGLIIDADGNLYGTTSQGGNFGCGHGCGTVFELSHSSSGGWTEKILYAFSGADDGGTPVSGLVMDSSGSLYGTASSGGPSSIYCAQGCGVIFRLQPGTNGSWTETVLHSFCSANGCLDGATPNGVNIDAAGNIYCTTGQLGQYGGGTLLQLIPNQKAGWTKKLIHTFGQDEGLDGEVPNPGLVFDASGNLYGTTNKGGRNKAGTIFQLTRDTNGLWSGKILHNFCSAENCADGGLPAVGLTLGSNGHLYGTTFVGGPPYGFGAVFEIASGANDHWSYAVLYNSISGNLNAPITVDSAGNLFTTTAVGGEFDLGSVLEVTPQN